MISNGVNRADKLVLFICALVIAAAVALVGSAQIAFADEGSTDDPTNESLDSEFDDESDDEASDFDDEASDWDDDDSDWDDDDSDWDEEEDSDFDDDDSDWDDEASDWGNDDDSDWDDDEDWDWDDDDEDWDWDDEDWDWDDEDWDWDDEDWDFDSDADYVTGSVYDLGQYGWSGVDAVPSGIAYVDGAVVAKGTACGSALISRVSGAASYGHYRETSAVAFYEPLAYGDEAWVSDVAATLDDGFSVASCWAFVPQFGFGRIGQLMSGAYAAFGMDSIQASIDNALQFDLADNSLFGQAIVKNVGEGFLFAIGKHLPLKAFCASFLGCNPVADREA